MPNYQPLNLSSLCNAGPEILGSRERPPIGRQEFHGLPFLVGHEGTTADERNFILMNDSSGSLTIPVNNTANNVVFVHRALDTEIPEGGPVGNGVADYAIHYANGQESRSPIRDRPDASGRGKLPCRLY